MLGAGAWVRCPSILLRAVPPAVRSAAAARESGATTAVPGRVRAATMIRPRSGSEEGIMRKMDWRAIFVRSAGAARDQRQSSAHRLIPSSVRLASALRACGLLLAVAAQPFLFDANSGCSFMLNPNPDKEPNSYQCACNCAPENRNRELRVSRPEDDAEQRLDNSVVLVNDPDLDFLNGRYIGLLFLDVGIPQNSTILQANVQ